MLILDTNALSELLRPQPDQAVLDWFSQQRNGPIHTTAITAAELRAGNAIQPDGQRKEQLREALDQIIDVQLQDRILAFTHAAVRPYAWALAHRRRIGRPISPMDGMIAAIALTARATLVTRNTRDFEGLGLPLIDPWRG